MDSCRVVLILEHGFCDDSLHKRSHVFVAVAGRRTTRSVITAIMRGIIYTKHSHDGLIIHISINSLW